MTALQKVKARLKKARRHRQGRRQERRQEQAGTNSHLTQHGRWLAWLAMYAPDLRVRQRAALELNRLRMAHVFARENRVGKGTAAVAGGTAAGGAAGAGLLAAGGAGAGAVGAAVGTGAGLTATGVGAAIGIPILAGAGIAVAAERLIQTKEEKLTASIKNVAKYKLNYEKCKARRLKKGKQAYPQDSRTGVFASNCHKDYKKWKDAEKLVAQHSKEVQDKLQSKGKLTRDMNADLTLMQQYPDISTSYERMRDKEERKRKHRQRGKSDAEAEALANAEMVDIDYGGEEETDNTMLWVVGGVVVVGALGLGGFAFLRR